MNVTSEVISTALMQILRQRRIGQGMCIGLETIRQDWRSTGLRESDLQLGLRNLEDAGAINVCPFEPRAYVELTGSGAKRLLPEALPDVADRSYVDEVVLYRIRQRDRSAFAYEHRRASDGFDRSYG